MGSHVVKMFLLMLAAALSLSAALFQSTQGEEQQIPAGRITAADAETLFFRKIQPLLREKCLGCHGDGDELGGELDLRTRESLLKGGEQGAAIVSGNADKSSLYQAVLRTGKVKMPPKEANKLTDDELAALKAWIDAGALWPQPKPEAKKQSEWNFNPEDTWAFQPVKRRVVPAEGIDESLIKTPIDAFVQQKLNEKSLAAAPDADRATLIRRMTYDLTGLPPTADEIVAFVKDTDADAFDKVLERLLASPRYGEHWGRHWLDVVRYSDTSGYSNDYERPNAWRYRDYVIRSFNTDKPFDRFVVEQLAGDELEPNDPEMRVAVGFLRMGPWEHTGMSVAAVTRQLFLDDVTDIVGTTFLGVTMGCCRCHDHKFDPLPTRDYYRLQAVFAPVQFEEQPAAFLAGENTTGFDQAIARVKERIKLNEGRLEAIRQKGEQAVSALLAEKGVKNVNALPAEQRPDKWYGLDRGDQERMRVYNKRLEYYNRELNRYQPQAYSVASGGKSKSVAAADVHILVGGSLETPGDKVTPGVLSAVYASNDATAPAAWNTIPDSTTGRRLALANWIASPEHPLTARVMVNRIWQYHFGKGLVETSNNFGKMGKRPTHPELLDWLAQYFVEHRWSVKAMHRLIMRSAAYQRGGEHPDLQKLAEADPENKLLAHFPSRRLTAEELRDSILQVSGELNLIAGGPGVFPEINLDVALQPRQIMGTLAPIYEPSPRREQRNRRTVYAFQIRNLANPLLEVFNAAGMNTSCERREESTVTPQVFALFNGQFAHDMALAMADRVVQNSQESSVQVTLAFRQALGRAPTTSELARCIAHLESMTTHHRRTTPIVPKLPNPLVLTHVGELTGARFEFVEDWDTGAYEFNLRATDVPPETRALAEICLVLLNSNEFAFVY